MERMMLMRPAARWPTVQRPSLDEVYRTWRSIARSPLKPPVDEPPRDTIRDRFARGNRSLSDGPSDIGDAGGEGGGGGE